MDDNNVLRQKIVTNGRDKKNFPVCMKHIRKSEKLICCIQVLADILPYWEVSLN